MLQWLQDVDVQMIHWVHQSLHNDVLNAIVPYLREKLVWIPLYIFLLGFTLINFKSKGWVWVLLFLFVVGLGDSFSSRVVKPAVDRTRPCHVEVVAAKLEMLVPCGGKYSFTSSHATNHFGMAFFIIFTLGKMFKWIRIPIFLWALSVGFAQVYVGVHYPLDIVGGALLGLIIGGFAAWYFNKRWGFRPAPA